MKGKKRKRARLLSGRQKAAVASAMMKPMTTNELWKAAKNECPKIQLRDVWRIIRSFIDDGLMFSIKHSPFCKV
jgi:hypothetical protein